MTEIGGESYWDGGLFNNTPLSPVIERLDPRAEVEKHLYVINLFPNAGAVPRSTLDVMDRMFELIFSNKLVKNVEMTQKVDEFIQALDEIEANLNPETRARVTGLQPELVFGPFDFSRRSIDKRIEAGYRAAAACLARGATIPVGKRKIR